MIWWSLELIGYWLLAGLSWLLCPQCSLSTSVLLSARSPPSFACSGLFRIFCCFHFLCSSFLLSVVLLDQPRAYTVNNTHILLLYLQWDVLSPPRSQAFALTLEVFIALPWHHFFILLPKFLSVFMILYWLDTKNRGSSPAFPSHVCSPGPLSLPCWFRS